MIPHFKTAMLVAAMFCGSPGNAGIIRLNNPRNSAILELKIDPWRPDGYKFGFQTSFGISRSEIGYLKIAPDGHPFLATEGEFSYYGPDRKFYKVRYVADENGYRPNNNFDHSLKETTRRLVLPDVDNDYFNFPEDDTSLPPPPPPTTAPPVSTDSPLVSSTEHGAPGLEVTEPIIEVPINATLGDRFGALPPGLVGSLLG